MRLLESNQHQPLQKAFTDLESAGLTIIPRRNKVTRCASTFSFMPEHRKKAAAKRAIHLYVFAVDAPFWQLVPVTLRRFLDENQAN